MPEKSTKKVGKRTRLHNLALLIGVSLLFIVLATELAILVLSFITWRDLHSVGLGDWWWQARVALGIWSLFVAWCVNSAIVSLESEKEDRDD